MLIQDFTLSTVPWSVRVYYHPSKRAYKGIIDYIYNNIYSYIGTEMDDIIEFLHEERKNSGCTVSDMENRHSVIVITRTSDAAEFNNTYDHEKGHLAMHICEADKINPFSEKYQYLVGEIGQKMFVAARHFLCDHCREKSE